MRQVCDGEKRRKMKRMIKKGVHLNHCQSTARTLTDWNANRSCQYFMSHPCDLSQGNKAIVIHINSSPHLPPLLPVLPSPGVGQAQPELGLNFS